MKTLIFSFLLLLAISPESWAQQRKSPPKAKAAKGAASDSAPKGFRKKEISFEERVIEGLGDRGYESLSQTGNVDPGARDKLYRKRSDFEEESQYLLREMEYLK